MRERIILDLQLEIARLRSEHAAELVRVRQECEATVLRLEALNVDLLDKVLARYGSTPIRQPTNAGAMEAQEMYPASPIYDEIAAAEAAEERYYAQLEKEERAARANAARARVDPEIREDLLNAAELAARKAEEESENQPHVNDESEE